MERIRLFMSLGQFDRAQEEVSKALAENPDDGWLHAWLAVVLLEQSKAKQALAPAERALGLEPDNDFVHYTLARVYLDLGRHAAAVEAIDQAIQLEPEDAANHVFKGVLHIRKQQWQKALDCANMGLAMDPEDEEGLNLQSMALTRLKRFDEADLGLDAALQHNPENSLTHTNLGWTELQRDGYARALEHFKEALRLDPDNEWAKDGLLDAMRSSNPLYRFFLKYSFWLSRFQAGHRNLILGVAFMVLIFGRKIGSMVPILEPVMGLVVPLLLIVCWLLWFARPVSNGVLMCHPLGRSILDPAQKRWTLAFLALIPLALFAVLLSKFVPYSSRLYFTTLGVLGMMLPISSILESSEKPEADHHTRASYITLGLGALLLVLALVGGRWALAVAYVCLFFALLSGLLPLFFSSYTDIADEEEAGSRFRVIRYGALALALLGAWHLARPLAPEPLEGGWPSRVLADIAPPAEQNAAYALVRLQGEACCSATDKHGHVVRNAPLIEAAGVVPVNLPSREGLKNLLSESNHLASVDQVWGPYFDEFMAASSLPSFYAAPAPDAPGGVFTFDLTLPSVLSIVASHRMELALEAGRHGEALEIADGLMRWVQLLKQSQNPFHHVDTCLTYGVVMKGAWMVLEADPDGEYDERVASLLLEAQGPLPVAEWLEDELRPALLAVIQDRLSTRSFGAFSQHDSRREQNSIIYAPRPGNIVQPFIRFAETVERASAAPGAAKQIDAQVMALLQGGNFKLGTFPSAPRRREFYEQANTLQFSVLHSTLALAVVRTGNRAELRRRMIRLALDLRKLESLPEQLDVLPIDPATGQPITYRLSEEGGMLCRAVEEPTQDPAEQGAIPELDDELDAGAGEEELCLTFAASAAE